MLTANKISIIDKLNHERLLDIMPVLIYMLVLTLTGVVGNTLVLYIYTTRFAKSASAYFIKALAVLDLLTCVAGMPFDIVHLVFWYHFPYPAMCKTLRFITYFTVQTSGITLIIVAFDRYYAVCKPFKRVSHRCTKILIVIAMLAGFMSTWPTIVLYGRKYIHFTEHNITTIQCSVEDSMANTPYPIAYFVFLLIMFLMCATCFVTVYTRILKQLRTQNRQMLRSPNVPQIHQFQGGISVVELFSHDAIGDICISDVCNSMNTRCPRMMRTDSTRVNQVSIMTSGQKKIRVERTAKIFFVIFCFFILSYLPGIILITLRSFIPDILSFPSLAADIFYHMFIRSYFINNAVNPFIYAFLDTRFRKECLKIAAKMTKICR